jgi:DNA-binding HxlR family transcriptional regulator
MSAKEKIIITLKKHQPARFKELKKYSELSARWLANVLSKLTSEGVIKKVISDVKLEDGSIKHNVEAYILTEKGNAVYEEFWGVLFTILELKERQAKKLEIYYQDKTMVNYILDKEIDPQISNTMISIFEGLGRVTHKEFISKYVDAIKDGHAEEEFKFLQSGKGKVVIGVVFDLAAIGDYLYRYAKFSLDLKDGIDPFTDKELKLFRHEYDITFDGRKPREDPANALNRLYETLRYADEILEDKKYTDMMLSYISNNLESFCNTYAIDPELLKRFNEYVTSGRNPLDDPEMLNKLIIRTKYGVSIFFYKYAEASKILNFRDKKINSALDKFRDSVGPYQVTAMNNPPPEDE